jgi:hypothetical protein
MQEEETDRTGMLGTMLYVERTRQTDCSPFCTPLLSSPDKHANKGQTVKKTTAKPHRRARMGVVTHLDWSVALVRCGMMRDVVCAGALSLWRVGCRAAGLQAPPLSRMQHKAQTTVSATATTAARTPFDAPGDTPCPSEASL